MAISMAAGPAAIADGANGEVRGYMWPGGNNIPNWEGTYRMPDGQEAWCASIWSPEPIYADAYGEAVPLTKNDGSPLSQTEMQTLAYVVSASSDAVLYQSGKSADDHAAAASVIIHDITNSNPASYDPEWPLTAFDNGEDPLGTGQVTSDVRSVYNSLLSDAASFGGQWQINWDTAPTGLTVGESIQLAGTLETTTGTPIPGREVRLSGTGLTPESTTATTDSDGRFTLEVTVQVPQSSITAAITAPATTVMMREPISWTSDDRPQNMILVDDSQLEVPLSIEAEPAAVPTIGTSVRDQTDGDRIIPADGGTAIDTVTYENLTAGTPYTLEGELYDKATGSPTGITGSTTFTPSDPNGVVEVSFTVPPGFAGTELVVFEYLYDSEDNLVAEHTDINDEAQTITVSPYSPGIGTSAADQADGDRILQPEGGTVIDTVTYWDLTPGVEYFIEGVMVDKQTGQETNIRSEATFTPTTSHGTVEVTFEVPGGHAGRTLVVFEYLYDSEDNLVAEHTDINDEAQTIHILRTSEPPPLAETGPPIDAIQAGIVTIMLLLAAGTITLIFVRHRTQLT